MLSKIADTLLGDDNIRVMLEDVSANLSDFVDLLLESVNHVGLLGHLHVSLGLSLLVLKRAVEQEDSWVADFSAHLWVGDVFIEHYTIKNGALVKHASRNLLDLGITLDLEVELGGALDSLHDGSAGLESEVGDQASPTSSELSTDARGQSFLDIVIVVDVDWDGDLVDNLEGVFESLVVRSDDDGWVDLVLDEWTGGLHHLTGKADDGGGAVSDFLVLGAGQLNHRLGSWVLAVDLSEDGIAVVGHNDTSHRIEKHLEHRAWAEGGGHDIGDCLHYSKVPWRQRC